jgi:putative endonuclease
MVAIFCLNYYNFISMPSHLYILFSEKIKKYYIGSTTDIERRIIDHNRGKEKFTKTGMPWVIVYTEIFEDLIDARRRELYIKKQKSRKFIEALISSAG